MGLGITSRLQSNFKLKENQYLTQATSSLSNSLPVSLIISQDRDRASDSLSGLADCQ